MTRIELRSKLINQGIRSDMYSLEGGLPNEAYCLNKKQKGWEVYYSERGGKTGLKLFDSESEACEYFLQIILKDKSY